MKPCGECSECCKGAFEVQVHNHKIGKGISCPNLGKTGCSIHSSRPNVCRNYNCEWKINDDMPDFMRPDKSKVLITHRAIKGHNYLDVVAIPNHDFDPEGLSHIIRYAVLTGKNIIWRKNNYDKDAKLFFLGTPEFMQMIVEDQQMMNNF